MPDSATTPSYLAMIESGEFALRESRARQLLSNCTLCPRRCGANRNNVERGFCGAGNFLEIAWAGPHFGEEPPLIGTKGAGTIFFTHCSLRCCFCQNYQISQQGMGRFVSEEALSEIMLDLQYKGCHNINLVTSSHYLPFILKAIRLAADRGLKVPLVYNSSGYETVDTLRLVEGIVDIYLPDWKYGEERIAREYSNAVDYPCVCLAAITEMYRQVGNLQVDNEGIAQRGIIVRHLVLPHHLANTELILSLLVENFSPSIKISLMSQYAPAYQAPMHPPLDRNLLPHEHQEALQMMEACAFDEYWVQELESNQLYLPDFSKMRPFPGGYEGSNAV